MGFYLFKYIGIRQKLYANGREPKYSIKNMLSLNLWIKILKLYPIRPPKRTYLSIFKIIIKYVKYMTYLYPTHITFSLNQVISERKTAYMSFYRVGVVVFNVKHFLVIYGKVTKMHTLYLNVILCGFLTYNIFKMVAIPILPEVDGNFVIINRILCILLDF